jgi:pimeloyl-ACP methyl ester carboxylesterase
LLRIPAFLLLAGVLAVAGRIVRYSVESARGGIHPTQHPSQYTCATSGIPGCEDISFASADGIPLRGWFAPPDRGTNTVILLAHGHAGNRDMLLPEARLLAGAGYGVLLFDFRGSGASGAATVTIGLDEQRDLQAAIDFAAARAPGARLGAIGFSMGAAVVAQVAARDERLEAVVLEASFPALKDELLHRARIFGPLSQISVLLTFRAEGVDMAANRPIDSLCAIAPRPVLLVYGTLDETIPPGTPEKMYAAACKPKRLLVIPDAGHHNYLNSSREYHQLLLEFFR